MKTLISRLTLKATVFVFIFTLAGGLAWAAPNDLQPINPDLNDGESMFAVESGSDQDAMQRSEQSGIQGMLKGSVLGKLFFNQPFERASLIDIVAILLLTFLISRIISRPGSRNGGIFGKQNSDEYDTHNPNEEKKSGPAAPPQGFDPWERLKSDKEKPPKSGKTIFFPTTKSPQQNPIPEAYSAESAHHQAPMEQYPENDEFLEGAKLIYARLNEAVKKQELDFIEHFTSPDMYRHFLKIDKNDYLDIVKVDARVIKETLLDGDPFVTVEFNVLAHKSKQSGPPSEIKEIWAFLEPSSTGTWRLEEIK